MSTTDEIHEQDRIFDIRSHAPANLQLALRGLTRLKYGRLHLTLPNEKHWTIAGEQDGPVAEASIHDWRAFQRILSSGDIGLADAYIAGELDTPDLTRFLSLCSVNFDAVQRLAVGHWFTRMFNAMRHKLLKRNSKSGSRRNILAHYDLGNSFYERWLDPSITYSSAIFSNPTMSLEDAQTEKYRRIARQIGARPGAHILEIGSGWGGFAEVAAKEFGARVTSLTISDAQHTFATERIKTQNLDDLVEIRLQDYRDVQGRFDGVASIEMFEAVGEDYWPDYFGKISNILKPGGAAALQIITIDDDLFPRYRKRSDFIQHYIFPGGMLPSSRVLNEHTSRVGLQMEDAFMFGADYAETLRQWREAFDNAWEDIAPMGFDDQFRRLWRFYLAYCEAGFATGRIDVGQFTLRNA